MFIRVYPVTHRLAWLPNTSVLTATNFSCGIWSNQQMLSPHDNYYFYDSARGEEAFIGLKLPFTLPSILSLLSQARHFTKKFSYCTFIMSSIL